MELYLFLYLNVNAIGIYYDKIEYIIKRGLQIIPIKEYIPCMTFNIYLNNKILGLPPRSLFIDWKAGAHWQMN